MNHHWARGLIVLGFGADYIHTMWLQNRSDTNKAQKQAKNLKFQILEEEELCYLLSQYKGADKLSLTAKLICVFVFLYVFLYCWFSHEVAKIAPIDLQWEKLKKNL